MKSFIILTIFACIVLSDALPCTMKTDCTKSNVLSCSRGFEADCTSGQCTCHQTSSKVCTAKSDCPTDVCDVHIFGQTFHRGHFHCVDGKCRCTFGN
uniref:Uncharacterized protein n=1 Tax=Pinctada fucata TaxID=50426 RepID=A0A194AJI4_PINFU